MRPRTVMPLFLVIALGLLTLGLAIGVSAKQSNDAAVRSVTARFHSLRQAEKAGYVPFYMCAEQPGVGTMGQHYVNFDLVGDPAIDPLRPEALVYEPQPDGSLKLVALEWVRVGAPEATGPTVLGQPLFYRSAPNRYGIEPGFYERHYWLYRSNPAGAFEDWNPTVSCHGTGDGGG
ncbi:MAG TPA: hypothetical protein VD763_03780 [Candidatus Saccharimonadales bacterium]|nr:hypothetical protein [Candidatus Saccharimonadales bacterium]